jgi:hypothetical protein
MVDGTTGNGRRAPDVLGAREIAAIATGALFYGVCGCIIAWRWWTGKGLTAVDADAGGAVRRAHLRYETTVDLWEGGGRMADGLFDIVIPSRRGESRVSVAAGSVV